MDRPTGNKILQMLKAYYPKYYGANIMPDQATMMVDDFCESFKAFDNESVIEEYKAWHLESNVPPAISTILGRLRANKKEKVDGTKWVLVEKNVPGYSAPILFAYRREGEKK